MTAPITPTEYKRNYCRWLYVSVNGGRLELSVYMGLLADQYPELTEFAEDDITMVDMMLASRDAYPNREVMI